MPSGAVAFPRQFRSLTSIVRDSKSQVVPGRFAKASLEEGPDWFARLYDGEPGAMKVIIDPTL